MKNLRTLMMIIILFPAFSYSNSWIDPFFEGAIKEAGLICIGTVEKSTPNETEIIINEIFKGKHKIGEKTLILRADIVGIGHENLALDVGMQYFFMVKKFKKNYIAFTDSYWNFPVNDTSVIVPIRDPLLYISIDRNHFKTFLSLILDKKSKNNVRSFVDARVNELNSLNPFTKDYQELHKQVFNLEVIYFFGSPEHVPKITRFLESPYYHIRWSCIRALITCDGLDSRRAILDHLENEESPYVQSVIGKAVYQLNIKEAKVLLEVQIPKLSSENVSLRRNIMNPVSNYLPAPRYSYGAALMKLDGIKGSYYKLLTKAKRYIENNPNIHLDILENKETFYSIEKALENPHSVFILVLRGKELTELPSEIKKFKNLKSLNLSDSNIQQLPEFLIDLGLIELDLSDNKLSTIPETVFKCTTLRKIELRSNELTEIDTQLFNLTELEELILGSNSIKQIPGRINELINLKILDLRMNNLESLPIGITGLKNLKEIELYGNDFLQFPEILSECHSIKTILIGSNSIKHLPESILNMKNLKYVDLSYNPLSLKEKENISKLPARIIINTQTYKDRFYSVYEAVDNKEIATIIHDSDNDYSDFQLDLSVLKMAKNLVLSNNKFNKFPNGVTELNNLKSLVLAHNNIEKIPEGINKMKNLSYLDLSYNNIKSLPPTIKELQLNYLNLSNNNFSETEKDIINKWFNEDCRIIW